MDLSWQHGFETPACTRACYFWVVSLCYLCSPPIARRLHVDTAEAMGVHRHVTLEDSKGHAPEATAQNAFWNSCPRRTIMIWWRLSQMRSSTQLVVTPICW